MSISHHVFSGKSWRLRACASENVLYSNRLIYREKCFFFQVTRWTPRAAFPTSQIAGKIPAIDVKVNNKATYYHLMKETSFQYGWPLLATSINAQLQKKSVPVLFLHLSKVGLHARGKSLDFTESLHYSSNATFQPRLHPLECGSLRFIYFTNTVAV